MFNLLCSCNLQDGRGECGEVCSQDDSSCGKWSDSPPCLFTFSLLLLSEKCFALISPCTRCYVATSDTCSDARPSIYGSPYRWSCQACSQRKVNFQILKIVVIPILINSNNRPNGIKKHLVQLWRSYLML